MALLLCRVSLLLQQGSEVCPCTREEGVWEAEALGTVPLLWGYLLYTGSLPSTPTMASVWPPQPGRDQDEPMAVHVAPQAPGLASRQLPHPGGDEVRGDGLSRGRSPPGFQQVGEGSPGKQEVIQELRRGAAQVSGKACDEVANRSLLKNVNQVCILFLAGQQT